MKAVRFGIIGFGNQGHLYANILTGNPHPGHDAIPQPRNCCLSAVCGLGDRSSEAEKLGAIWFSDWKALIDSGSCDAVIITTPHPLHPEMAVYALNKGLHVLCDKPAGIRTEDVAGMLDAQMNSGGAFGMMYQHRTNPVFRRIHQVIASGELGALRRSSWIMNRYWRPDSYYHENPWRGTWRGEGGGLLMNQLPHALDLWLWLCGAPEQVTARNRYGAYRNIRVETDISALMEYRSGATGIFTASIHDPMGTDRLELDFDGGKILVEDSTRATIYRFTRSEQEWNRTLSFQQMQALRDDPSGYHQVEVIENRQPFGTDYAQVMENFAEHILEGAPLIADGEAGFLQTELANTIALSGWLAERISFPCDWDLYNRLLRLRMDQEL